MCIEGHIYYLVKQVEKHTIAIDTTVSDIAR